MQDSSQRASQTAWLQNLVQQKASRNLLDQAFKTQAARELTAAIADVRTKLVNLKSQQAQQELRDAVSKLADFVRQQGIALQTAQYQGELERIRLSLLQDFIRQVNELRCHGGV